MELQVTASGTGISRTMTVMIMATMASMKASNLSEFTVIHLLEMSESINPCKHGQQA